MFAESNEPIVAMTEREREDLRQAIVILERALVKTQQDIIGYPPKDEDKGFRFLIEKAKRLQKAIEGFQQQLDDDS